LPPAGEDKPTERILVKHKSIINRIISKGAREEELHQICAGGLVAEMVADLLKLCTDPEGRLRFAQP
jgi:hypothetical protein